MSITMSKSDADDDKIGIEPDHPDKATSPTQITKASWGYILKKTLREFGQIGCTDLAAGLTYFAVLSLFPALLAIISILGVVGQAETTTNAVITVLGDFVPKDTLKTVQPFIEGLAKNKAASITLLVGVLGALWTASGYVGAFGRAMNKIYEVPEGRPFWKLKPMMILITLTVVVLLALMALMLALSGGIAQSIGNAIGLGSTTVTAWNYAKLPVILIIVVLVVALLFYATPNVKQSKFRWISIGAFVAIVIWALASAGLGFYVGNFGSYDKTYGALGGVIVTLLWVWITNNALLFGAVLDAELERARQLQAGIRAEENLQLPPRNVKGIAKNEEKGAALVQQGREIRLEAEARDDAEANRRRDEYLTKD